MMNYYLGNKKLATHLGRRVYFLIEENFSKTGR
jgi:hypothetical protein